jgi:hypothetical protein
MNEPRKRKDQPQDPGGGRERKEAPVPDDRTGPERYTESQTPVPGTRNPSIPEEQFPGRQQPV